MRFVQSQRFSSENLNKSGKNIEQKKKESEQTVKLTMEYTRDNKYGNYSLLE